MSAALISAVTLHSRAGCPRRLGRCGGPLRSPVRVRMRRPRFRDKVGVGQDSWRGLKRSELRWWVHS